jgi:hypothetical protein
MPFILHEMVQHYTCFNGRRYAEVADDAQHPVFCRSRGRDSLLVVKFSSNISGRTSKERKTLGPQYMALGAAVKRLSR